MPKEKEIQQSAEQQEQPEQSKEDKLIVQVADMLAKISDDFNSKIEELNAKIDSKQVKPQVVIPENFKSSGSIEAPVPEDIANLVHSMISPRCQIKVETSKSDPSYLVSIIIPPEMSKETNQPDIRSKNIKYSEGLPKIKEWLTLVKKNIWTEFAKNGESVPNI